MKIITKHFGKLKNGKDVYRYILYNDNGIEIAILNYGGIITDINLPDINGNKENVTLSFDNILDYEEKSPHFGCITGRVAGRISNAEFYIDNEKYKLYKNDNNACIHGGQVGLSKRIWNVKELKTDNSIGIELKYFSPHMEDLFPGNVTFTVKYILNNNNELILEYFGESDRKTIMNLTNHAYFNLAGAGREAVLNHLLKVDSDYYVPVNDEIIPLGDIEKVDNSHFDFRREKELEQVVKSDHIQVKNVGGLDHAFVLKGLSDKPNIIVFEKKSRRYIEVRTDQPAVVIYSGCQMDNNLILANERRTERYGALCLETQDFPDGVNQDKFPTKYIDEKNPYYGKTIFKFGII